METLTKKTQAALLKKLADEYTPLAKDLESSGWPDWRIENLLQRIKKRRVKQFYEDQACKKIGHTIGLTLDWAMRQVKPDSQTEVIFYAMLNKACIEFEFQVKIGKYRVDYLIGKSLIFEGDGPQHDASVEYDNFRDKYLESLGYTVLRLKWELVALMPDTVLEIIKEESAKIINNGIKKNG